MRRSVPVITMILVAMSVACRDKDTPSKEKASQVGRAGKTNTPILPTPGADTGIRVVTTTKTNAETGIVDTKDVFTRDGKTNLVLETRTKSGVVQIRIHRFYHGDLLVGSFVAMPDSSGFTTEAGCPYTVTAQFGPTKEVQTVTLGLKGVVVDAFNCTNGVFSPVESLFIEKANHLSSEINGLLSPEHVRKTSPEDFGREIERFVEKHQNQ